MGAEVYGPLPANRVLQGADWHRARPRQANLRGRIHGVPRVECAGARRMGRTPLAWWCVPHWIAQGADAVDGDLDGVPVSEKDRWFAGETDAFGGPGEDHRAGQ